MKNFRQILTAGCMAARILRMAAPVIFLAVILFAVADSVFAQGGQKFASGGNSLSTGEFLGTTNNAALPIKTNNTQRAVFGATGNFGLNVADPGYRFHLDGSICNNAFAGGGMGLLLYDNSGVFQRLAYSNNAKHVLLGTGVFGVYWDDDWTVNGNNMTTIPTGNVGIGIAAPTAKLEVGGDVKVNGNFQNNGNGASAGNYSVGGTLTADKLDDANGGNITVDVLKVNQYIDLSDNTFLLSGRIESFDDLYIQSASQPSTFNTLINPYSGFVGIGTDHPSVKFDVVGNSKVTGNSEITGDLTVGGTINAANLNIANTNTSFENITVNNNTSTGGLFVRDNLLFEGNGVNKIAANSHNLLFADTYVGFGIAPDPLYTVNIAGDAHVSGYLYVSQGVIIGEKIRGDRVEGKEMMVEEQLTVRDVEVARLLTSREMATEKLVVDTLQTDSMSMIKLATEQLNVSELIEAKLLNVAERIIGDQLELVQDLKVGGRLTINGDKIYSNAGNISFEGNNLNHIGTVNASNLSASGTGNFNNLFVTNSITVGSSMMIDGYNSTNARNHIYTDGVGDSKLYVQSNAGENYHTIINNGNEGFVGIGTDEPEKKLHVKTVDGTDLPDHGPGDDTEVEVDSKGSLRLEHTWDIGTSIWDFEPIVTYILGPSSGSFHSSFQFQNGATGNSVLTLTDDNKVGIGTNNPGAKLHIAGDIKIDNVPDNTDNAAKMLVYGSNGKISKKDIPNMSDLFNNLNSNADGDLSIGSTGNNVSIGSSGSDVSIGGSGGNVTIGNTTGGTISMGNLLPDAAAPNMVVSDAVGKLGTISKDINSLCSDLHFENSKLGIGMTPVANGQKLQVSGGAQIDGMETNLTGPDVKMVVSKNGILGTKDITDFTCPDIHCDGYGNVGVGTGEKDDIFFASQLAGGAYNGLTTQDNSGIFWNDVNHTGLVIGAWHPGTANSVGIKILNNGNVGIGIGNPAANLHIKGTQPVLKIEDESQWDNNQYSNLRIMVANGATRFISNNSVGFFINGNASATDDFRVSAHATSYDGEKLLFRITEDGNQQVYGNLEIIDNAGINIKLYSNGNLWAKKVKVYSDDPWSDYVFDKEYNLLSLPELEKYIATHKHLPEIPSESDVKKDGIDLGSMDALLLKKIEELTLHAIEQQKQIENMKCEIELLKNK